ncbi:histidine kinase dimerization/phospho-acceptor domain-containing protein, partial [Pseudomonas sp. FW306-02-H05-AA]|uniref:histidine kinase dimerization/phospho-acceptor domain-containing protein n=1 Tax=Pseudomonas sp. FW306-02-H05-AA TaxID=2070657 RepID=UPI000CC8ED33
RELQDFASIAAHDLQEPLRKILAFGDRLNTRNGANLDPDGRDYLERMLSSARRMRKLIDDLLTYSRVTTKAQPYRAVDLNE